MVHSFPPLPADAALLLTLKDTYRTYLPEGIYLPY